MGNVGVKPDTLADGAINAHTDTVITASDEILFGDVTDSNNLKKDTVQGILDLVPAGGGLVHISTVTASASSTIDFLSSFSSTYDTYLVTWSNAIPSAGTPALVARVAIAGAARSTAGDYAYGVSGYNEAAAEDRYASISNTYLQLINNVGEQSGENTSGHIWFYDPLGTDNNKGCSWEAVTYNATPTLTRNYGGGMFQAALTALTGCQFLMSSGNVATGVFSLYGLAKS